MALFGDVPLEDGLPTAPAPLQPLAERMRPRMLAEFLGQEALLPGRSLRVAIEQGSAGSLILWGPPGIGKTTLAHLIAKHANMHFTPFSAVLAGVAQVREAVRLAAAHRRNDGRGTLLFVDEIHRFNKAQQDAFLPHVERGELVLVGATTENPSFAVNAALLSRCRVVPLHPLPASSLQALVQAALRDTERGLGVRRLEIDAAAVDRLVDLAGGDARRTLNCIEVCAATCLDGDTIDSAMITEAFQQRVLALDRDGDMHFDLLSALHKSLRNSDVQASVYWLIRALDAGADPVHAARRMVAMASEDIGLADPMALQVAVAALHALQFLGLPEGRLSLTQAAVYLAAAPKSNAVLRAVEAASECVRNNPAASVPLWLRNAPTALLRGLGHGSGYVYAHDTGSGVAAMPCLPPDLGDPVFFTPSARGFEQKVGERMADNERRRRGG